MTGVVSPSVTDDGMGMRINDCHLYSMGGIIGRDADRHSNMHRDTEVTLSLSLRLTLSLIDHKGRGERRKCRKPMADGLTRDGVGDASTPILFPLGLPSPPGH